MSTESTSNFLDSMAKPVMLRQAKLNPKQALRQKVMNSMTDMLEAIKQHRSHESTVQTNSEEKSLDNGEHLTGKDHSDVIEDIEPLQLRRRLVFRSNVDMPKRELLLLQKSYKKAEAFINKVLIDHAALGRKEKEIYGREVYGFSEEDGIILRCALREHFQNPHSQAAERVTSKLKAKFNGLEMANPEIRELDLFEQFFNAQGAPNAAEKILLSRVSGHIAAKKKDCKAIGAIRHADIGLTQSRTSEPSAPGSIPTPTPPRAKHRSMFGSTNLSCTESPDESKNAEQ
ncbi:MAG: hypothetical protein Q9201_006025 [Fulgogasparrea decipioides]